MKLELRHMQNFQYSCRTNIDGVTVTSLIELQQPNLAQA